jgi:monoamine oxidase
MGENVKLVLGLREPVWEKQGLTSELTSDGVVGLTWAATEARNGRGPVALTLFSGADQAETMRRYAPPERRLFALASVAPAYPTLGDAIVKERFIDWPGFPLTRASYSFPAPGQVTAFGPVLVDGIAEDGFPTLLFAGEHTSYGFIGYMEGALSSGVRAARDAARHRSARPNAAPPATQPRHHEPADTRPAPQTAPRARNP